MTSATLNEKIARISWSTPEGNDCILDLEPHNRVHIGRSRDCEINILNTLLSRKHSLLICGENDCSLQDLNSKNGTYLNGERITETVKLKNGDRFKVGPVYFYFEELEISTAKNAEDNVLQDEKRETFIMPEPSQLPHLEIISGNQKGTIFELKREKLRVGRSGLGKSWDITLHDRAVSRPQAEIYREEEKWVLADLNSANGTLVNNQRIIQPVFIQKGDAITFGETVLIFHSGDIND